MDTGTKQAAVVPAEDLAQAGLLLDIDGPVATITLNRPDKRNAMTFAMWRTLARIGDALPGSVRVVVVRGAGKAFSAGIDLSMFSSPEGPRGDDPEAGDRFIAELQAGYTWLRRPEIVSIAAVHGYAIGAAFQLALSCDLRVMAEDAWLCMKEPALGLVPDLTGTKPLVDIVGVHRAIDICLTARKVPAEEAARLGLAERVVPAAELETAVRELTGALLAVDAGAAVATKRLLWQAPGNTLEEQCAAERREQLARLRALRGN
ncbi:MULTISPECIES: enoyl-CoA hydratase/isomerase family protein [Thermomonospora]|uniref:Enoyl-CoA hydratase/isomerase n=1 Tax=Thermomonospora curvata (strain ATCC 19995 / DSM 43183 / JCM 3096 / KCTC 9072 / NBRC 15933 / NCIMB 10081 / Henssen B9) TaxID=471852 RepID=D1A1W8_THECD|nr:MULTISPECIES: enoyl-CoA hydratase/isomerase family protein [Thermomonospora]ACY97806.1 Enoyl-CoA hydratase/isomerase [Thermomonospora curvata DSM 43183]PKK14100.1 MAG: enoyl-CoA hydratase/isomerase family protein [Thermomonospora sp. CIF 1]